MKAQAGMRQRWTQPQDSSRDLPISAFFNKFFFHISKFHFIYFGGNTHTSKRIKKTNSVRYSNMITQVSL
jgi:hypothetical protein